MSPIPVSSSTDAPTLTRCQGGWRGFYLRRELNHNLSGNADVYTACSLPSILKNSCSKFDCQKRFNLNIFSYKIVKLTNTTAGWRVRGLGFRVSPQ